MAVRSVFAKAHIGHEKYLGESLLDCLDCEDYGSICGRSFVSRRVLSGGSKWNTEEDDGAEAKCNERLEDDGNRLRGWKKFECRTALLR